jgi:hypothetical protein
MERVGLRWDQRRWYLTGATGTCAAMESLPLFMGMAARELPWMALLRFRSRQLSSNAGLNTQNFEAELYSLENRKVLIT